MGETRTGRGRSRPRRMSGLVLLLAVFNTLVVRTSGNELVGPRAMSTYSGGGGRRRPTSYVRVKDPAVGFFVAGSSEEGLNGLYGRTDKAPPGASASDVEISYRHLDTGWFMALRRQRKGRLSRPQRVREPPSSPAQSGRGNTTDRNLSHAKRGRP